MISGNRRAVAQGVGVTLLAVAVMAFSAVAAARSGISTSCLNKASPGFRAYLPDCRAYELVSPTYKAGFKVEIDGVSILGNDVLARSFGSFADVEGPGTGLGQTYDFRRTADGWRSVPATASFSQFVSTAVTTVSPDFQTSLWSAHTPLQPLLEGLYSGPLTGPLHRIGPGEPPGIIEPTLAFAGASEDLSHALYIDRSPGSVEPVSHLWPGDSTARGRLPSLYEYAGTDNLEPRLVGVSDAGEPPSISKSHLISNCGTVLGSLPEGEADNAISANGEIIIFTAAASSSCSSTGPPVNEIYARVSGARTVAISEPTPSDCTCDLSTMADAQFRGASRDGSKVFFTTDQRLLPASITGMGPYLYEYDFNAPENEKIKLISKDVPAAISVEGVVRVSDDGSHIYFVAAGVLTGTNKEGRSPVAGFPNLYVWSNEGTELVATLSASDREDWSPADIRPVQTTPDGRYLIFQSDTDLTFDQEGLPEAEQVFSYDSKEKAITRVSRGRDGYNNDGNSSLYPATIPRQNYLTDDPIQHFTHLALSADGSRVFFSSKDALVPQAVVGIDNIYEYETDEERVSMISDGHDIASTLPFAGVELIGTDLSGSDLFFITDDRLVPQDTDTQTDLYDARINGGAASTIVGTYCSKDACQGPASALFEAPSIAPVTGEAPSSTINSTIPNSHPTKLRQRVKVKHKPKRRRTRRSKRSDHKSRLLNRRR